MQRGSSRIGLNGRWLTGSLARGRDSWPRGETALRERLPEEEDEPDRWARYVSDSRRGNEPVRRGSTCTF